MKSVLSNDEVENNIPFYPCNESSRCKPPGQSHSNIKLTVNHFVKHFHSFLFFKFLSCYMTNYKHICACIYTSLNFIKIQNSYKSNCHNCFKFSLDSVCIFISHNIYNINFQLFQLFFQFLSYQTKYKKNPNSETRVFTSPSPKN